MTSAPTCPNLMSRLRDFSHAKGGMAAVEFAVILPFMLTAYIGGVEIGDGVAIDRKVAITTRAVADLASRNTKITNADMTTILNASATIIAPFPSAPLSVTISGVIVDNRGNATIDWSDTLNGTARTKGSAVTLPGTLNSAGSYYVWGEVRYAYTPTLGYVMTGTWNLSNQIFMSPRESAAIVRSAT
jgi:Flp pilus assembly protein TadG